MRPFGIHGFWPIFIKNTLSFLLPFRCSQEMSRRLGGEPDLVQACMRPCPPDALPIMGKVPHVRGAYISAGHNCWGILWAPVSGLAMSELILDGAASCVDLRHFSPARFARSGSAAALRGRKMGTVPVGEQWWSDGVKKCQRILEMELTKILICFEIAIDLYQSLYTCVESRMGENLWISRFFVLKIQVEGSNPIWSAWQPSTQPLSSWLGFWETAPWRGAGGWDFAAQALAMNSELQLI